MSGGLQTKIQYSREHFKCSFYSSSVDCYLLHWQLFILSFAVRCILLVNLTTSALNTVKVMLYLMHVDLQYRCFHNANTFSIVHQLLKYWNQMNLMYMEFIHSFIYGGKRDEIGEWRRIYNEKLDSFYHLPNILSYYM